MNGRATPPRVDAVQEVAIAQARALARAGRYAEAEQLLEGEHDPIALDLKARVYAQQGRLDEADRCWAAVADHSPGDPGAAAGRRRIAEIRAKAAAPGRLLLARTVLRLGAAAAVVLAFVMLLDVWQDRDTPAPEPRAVPSSVTPSADPLAHLNLGIRGTHVERRPGEIAVTFDDGLFRRDANLTPRGRAVLEDLGERLRPYGNQITVAVLGHTDRKAVHPGGGYASNAELGLLRATVVREVLRSSARIPTSRFSVSTLAALLPPHSGKADVRNRTVSLRISSAGGR